MQCGFSWFVFRWVVCWIFIIIEFVVLVPMHFRMKKRASFSKYSLQDRHGIFTFGPVALELKHKSSLFDVRIHFWIYLYVMALIATTFMMDTDELYKPIILAAPFLLATGSFLILSCDQIDGEVKNDEIGDEHGNFFLQILRSALRMSLFDMFQMIGDDIAEDEILQLNMLRWIVDLWAGTDKDSQHSSSSSNQTHQSYQARSFQPVQHESESSTNRSASRTSQPHANINISQNYSAPRSSESTFDRNSSNQETFRHSQERRLKLPSFFHVDERAKPAIQSFKAAVASFPPSRNACIVLAVTKRCPAALLVICLHLFALHNANCVTIILLPMMLLEFMRVSEWRKACFSAFAADDDKSALHTDMLTIPASMEHMQILLSGNTFSNFNPGSSLQLWTNVKSSVVALESSLTAVKCVNTAKFATDVAMDVMSLAKLGFEVKEKGIPYGVSVLVKDLFHFHMEKAMSENNELPAPCQEGRGGLISKTTMNLVNNAQVLTKNINELLEDGTDQNNMLSPVIGGVSTVLGRGWLWGKDEHNTEDKFVPSNDQGSEDDRMAGETVENASKDNIRQSGSVEQASKHTSDYVDMDYEVGQSTTQYFDEDLQHSQSNENTTLSQKPEEKQTMPTVDNSTDMSNEKFQRIDIDETQVEEVQRANPNIATDTNDNASDGVNALGAGLAVVAGVIAGGVAFALKGDESKRNEENTNSTSHSHVTIERLDGED